MNAVRDGNSPQITLSSSDDTEDARSPKNLYPGMAEATTKSRGVGGGRMDIFRETKGAARVPNAFSDDTDDTAQSPKNLDRDVYGGGDEPDGMTVELFGEC